MVFLRGTLRLGAAAMLLLAAACGSMSAIKSNKSPSYAGGIKRLFGEADLGTALTYKMSGDEPDVFASTFAKALTACGTQTELHLEDVLDLKEDTGQRVRQFGPDAVLQIKVRSMSTATKGGTIAGFVLSLFDMKSRSVVWKAELTFVPLSSAGAALAASIIGQMKQDGLIDASCVVPEAS